MMYLTSRLFRHRLTADTHVFVNTLSGAIDVLEDAQVRELDDAVALGQERSSPLLDQLSARGYLFASREEEDALFDEIYRAVRATERLSSPVFIICPTYSCFFRCTYCYEGKLTALPHRSSVSAADVLRGADALSKWLEGELGMSATPRVTFLGGEPLQPRLEPFIRECLEGIHARGWGFRIITNGFLLHLFLEDLLRHRASLQTIQITLDGPPDVHDKRRRLTGGGGTFGPIAQNVTRALAVGLPVSLRTNVDAENVQRLPDLAAELMDRGWFDNSHFSAQLAPTEDSTCRGLAHPMRETDLLAQWTELVAAHPQLARFDDRPLYRVTAPIEFALRDHSRPISPRFSYCAATRTQSYAFGPDGRIYQCLRGVGDERTAVGKFQPSLTMDHDRVEKWRRRDIVTTQCPNCLALGSLVGGGCALEALHVSGELETCMCGGVEETLRHYLDLRRELILSHFSRKQMQRRSKCH